MNPPWERPQAAVNQIFLFILIKFSEQKLNSLLLFVFSLSLNYDYQIQKPYDSYLLYNCSFMPYAWHFLCIISNFFKRADYSRSLHKKHIRKLSSNLPSLVCIYWFIYHAHLYLHDKSYYFSQF